MAGPVGPSAFSDLIATDIIFLAPRPRWRSLDVADTITIRTDDETERALDVLTSDGSSRSAAIRQAVLNAAHRRERAAEMRRAVLRLDLGEPDGVNVADELARDRASER